MVQQVKDFDGKTYEFPDDATPEEINSLLPKAPQKSLISEAANSPITQGILGAGDALRNVLSLGTLKNSPTTNFGFNPGSQSGEGTAYNIGNIAGNVGGFIGGGEALESLPLIGKAASALGNTGLGGALKRTAGASLYGAAENPDERLKGGLEGAAGGALGEAVPFLGKNIVGAVQPNKYAKELIDKISGGQSLQENAKILANKLTELYKNSKNKAKELYDPIIKHSGLGGSSIYNEVNPSGIHAYVDKPDLNLSNPQGKLKNYFDSFQKDPTLSNAHRLQSQLGSEANGIVPSDWAAQSVKNNYTDVRNQLKDHIYKFLEAKKTGLGEDYINAGNEYARTVSPYKENAKIRKIVNQKITNPKNIANIFASPEPGIEKIIDDLGEEGKDRILYAALNKQKGDANADDILTKLNDLNKKGIALSSNATAMTKALANRTKNRDLMQRGAGFLLGSNLPHEKIAGGIFGVMQTPAIMKSIQPSISNNLSNYLSKVLKTGYKGYLANTLS